MLHHRSRRTSRLALLAVAATSGLALLPGAAVAVPVDDRQQDACPDDRAKVLSWSYDITRANGTTETNVRDLTDRVAFGDTIVASFTLAPNCKGKMVSFASYRSISASGTPLSAQRLYDSDTGRFTSGKESRRFNDALTVKVFRPTTIPAASQTQDVQECQDQTPASKNRGANTPGPYDPNCDGSPSQNGNNNGGANGRPCAGCVGSADDKNPPGQLPGPQDKNNGYECDGNNGIAKGNPAHSRCREIEQPPFFQVDFATGPVIESLSFPDRMYGPDLIDYDNGPGWTNANDGGQYQQP